MEEKPEAEDDEPETPHTKLYFGNLPYNCDSAELAALIQDYASPELVEVISSFLEMDIRSDNTMKSWKDIQNFNEK